MDSSGEVKAQLRSLMEASDEDELKLLVCLLADIKKNKEQLLYVDIKLQIRSGRCKSYDSTIKTRTIA